MGKSILNRLIVVSNRVNVPDIVQGKATGGLVVAIEEALADQGGVWFGWSGKTNTDGEFRKNTQTKNNVDYITVDMPDSIFDDFYGGFCNSLIWPIFHYQIGLADFSTENFVAYREVNQRFASILSSHILPEDIVWVQDYHFISMARELRKFNCTNLIGFFLHIPWPAREVLLALPEHKNLVSDLLEYDLIGFQTKSHVIAFMDYVVRELDGVIGDNGTVYALGKTSRVKHFPVSIDANAFVNEAKEAEDSMDVQRLLKSLGSRKLMIGVDRLDYTKGIVNRFEAFELFLEGLFETAEAPTFMQISPVSRGNLAQYQEIRQVLEKKAGQINGKYSDFDWTPVRYLNKGFDRKVLAGFFRNSSVGLVTPLRDGMNLVAKEYVASQSSEDPGVLVLSQFAGAAEEMDGAVLVNPYNTNEISKAIKDSIEMPKIEKMDRWFGMMQRLQIQDIKYWKNKFLQTLKNKKEGEFF